MIDNYHVIIKSTKTNNIITEFRVTCKIGCLVENVRRKLFDLGYTYYNISNNLYMTVYINDENGVGDNKITSMI